MSLVSVIAEPTEEIYFLEENAVEQKLQELLPQTPNLFY